MNYYFRDIKVPIIKILDQIFGHNTYLMKGGQALALHFEKVQAVKEARFLKKI
jgi:hypothetical protein